MSRSQDHYLDSIFNRQKVALRNHVVSILFWANVLITTYAITYIAQIALTVGITLRHL